MTTLYDKIWNAHIVDKISEDDDAFIVYVDRHLVHEVTSPQAFEGLRLAGRPVRRPDKTLATMDHNIPTINRSTFKDVESFIEEQGSRIQCKALERNVKQFGISFFGLADKRQGIVHVIGPEQGFTLPGTTVVCGDSHTSTHGAFGALAFGIGTSEVEHVLATQTIILKKSKNMRILVTGELGIGVTSKDLILHIISVIGTAGGTGYVIEFAGSAIEALSMEARMSMCNMSIEAGARSGLIAPDEKTLQYLKGRPLCPKGDDWDEAVAYWRTLKTDSGAQFEKEVLIDAFTVEPTVTWGTSPQDATSINSRVPNPSEESDISRKTAMQRSLEYMGLEPGQPLSEIRVDKVFIGSCTNSRIEDLRNAARIAKGRKVAANVEAMVVPGSGLVKKQAEDEGLAAVFMEAGFDWREAGCSMCLGMNPDQLLPKERCASTSNRNFEGRQGAGGRTHLMSPEMAAAAAIAGHLVDCRQFITQDLGLAGVLLRIEDDSSKLYANGQITRPKALASQIVIENPSVGNMKFSSFQGIAAPFDLQNVDTDMIIPKQFLKTVSRDGLGKNLFFSARYDADGKPKAEFVLNQSRYKNAEILIAGDNFGCGSSREHAPWALKDFGIKVVISTSFGEIFYNNSLKNGLLPVRVTREQVTLLLDDADKNLPLSIELETQTVKRSNGEAISFQVDPFSKRCILEGLDEISITLKQMNSIKQYEASLESSKWLSGIPLQ